MNQQGDAQKAQKGLFTTICLQGADELRKTLTISENGYRFVVGSSHYETREYYIYGVLDELEKAGVAMLRYEELLAGEQKSDNNGDEIDRITRNILTSVLDEQRLWIRKLTEILVEVISFLTTNTKEHFEHYLLIRELDALRKGYADLCEFFACDNENMKYSIQRLESDLRRVEASLNLNSCWYLNSKNPGTKRKFSDFRTRLTSVINTCTADQKLVLRLSYGAAYATPSGSLHVNIGKPDLTVSIEAIKANMSHIGLLAAHILLNSKKLLRTKPHRYRPIGSQRRPPVPSATEKRPSAIINWLPSPQRLANPTA